MSLFAVGGRRIGRVRMGEMVGVLVGLHIEGDGAEVAGAGRRVVGQRVNRDRRRSGCRDAAGVFEPRAAGGLAGRAFAKALDVVRFLRRESPERHFGFRQWSQLRDVRRP